MSLRKREKLLLGVGIGALWAARKSKRPAGPAPEKPYRSSLFWRVYDGTSQWIDHKVGWDKLPTPLGLAVLVGVRNILRKENLYDTTQGVPYDPPPYDPKYLTERTFDGSYNDLTNAVMGKEETRFGRNVPLDHTYQEPEEQLLSPSPRVVSLELMTRKEFLPATTVNLLAASWIQFMVKDWFNHGEGDPKRRWDIPLAKDDPWPDPKLTILKTVKDPTQPAGSTGPTTYQNFETHWWDASQIYGGGGRPEDKVKGRTGVDGKVPIGPDGLLQLPLDNPASPVFVPGWWLGLNMMATVWVREHNAVCDALKEEYPTWTDEELFQRARLVVGALMAKIHTVEWTPAIISHPTTVTALRANWWGLAGERVRKTFGRISSSEVISGIPGSETDHYGVPYSLTEEFTIVYRMHPLIPDDYVLRNAAADEVLAEHGFRDIAGPAAQAIPEQIPMSDLFYSFGTSYPGAIVLHNFPKFLQEFERPDNGKLMDLAAVDIMRSREFGVPRYNEFRRLVHLKPAESFEELTGDEGLADEVRRVYDGDIERVDLITGMFAERRPAGFAFSDTAFRIFIVMASRRLNSDRFFTKDFTPEVYTPVGLDWVQDNSMIDVLLRHYPELRSSMRGVTNAFHPWNRATGAAPVTT